MPKLSFSRLVLPLVVSGVITACAADEATSPGSTLLAGLAKSAANDTSNTTHSPVGNGPGYFRGTVLGQSPPGGGNDTLATAPRIAGVVATIYRGAAGGDGSTIPGEKLGTVTTGADGLFTLPTLPAGVYVVTFVPPASAGYEGVYVTGELRQNSSEYPWWIVLHKK